MCLRPPTRAFLGLGLRVSNPSRGTCAFGLSLPALRFPLVPPSRFAPVLKPAKAKLVRSRGNASQATNLPTESSCAHRRTRQLRILSIFALAAFGGPDWREEPDVWWTARFAHSLWVKLSKNAISRLIRTEPAPAGRPADPHWLHTAGVSCKCEAAAATIKSMARRRA